MLVVLLTRKVLAVVGDKEAPQYLAARSMQFGWLLLKPTGRGVGSNLGQAFNACADGHMLRYTSNPPILSRSFRGASFSRESSSKTLS